MALPNRSDYELIGDKTTQILSPNDDEFSFNIYGYKRCIKGSFLYHFIAIIFLGLPYAVFIWYPSLQKIRFQKVHLADADVIFVYNKFGNCFMKEVKIEIVVLPARGVQYLRIFVHQYTKYIWNEEKEQFECLDEFIPKLSLEDIVERSYGLYRSEEHNLINLYAENKIDVEIKSYWRLFVDEVFNPFYIFQIFSILLWFSDDYMIYAGCVLVLTLTSVITSLLQTRKQSVALHNIASTNRVGEFTILRRNDTSVELTVIDSSQLVPGHLLVIPRGGCVMPCDAVLLTGNCIVNESMLTGESVPILKTPPNSCDEIYNSNKHKPHTLFSGTHVLQGRYYGDEYITARVTRTGFETTKGALVKSIMFPSPVGFKFYKDSIKFVVFLFIIASFGMLYCLYLYIDRQADIKDIIIRTLDIITIAVPPALPAAMTVGIAYSQSRLKKHKIFCISPPKINISGKIKLACFDKTGTLTHEGLDMYSILPTTENHFSDAIEDIAVMDNKHPLVQCMATCHSLTRIDGVINGDPLDLSMFEHTKWVLEEPTKEDTNYDNLTPTIVTPGTSKNLVSDKDTDYSYQIGIIKQFQFSSTLQRMSVICKIIGIPALQNLVLFMKGAPEKILSMCEYETIPPDSSNRLAQYASQGFRVIALAYKELPSKFKWKDAQKVKRENIECDLKFLGFIIMMNTLKPQTAPVISKLHLANIRSVMITGDNIMTAICVARECGMVGNHDNVLLLHVGESNDGRVNLRGESVGNNNANNIIDMDNDHQHFAIEGKTWTKLKTHYAHLLPFILVRSTVFARFEPDQKTQLVCSFQELDYNVSMVGDGANDCGALKAAHVGISLSQAEASVAAPFTSSIDNIYCLIVLILEGRCALVTSFAVFKYMALYSLIQFFTIILLYVNYSILGDNQFLYFDLVVTFVLALTIGRQGPSNKLVAKRPMGSLISGSNLVPMCLQIIVCGVSQIGALYYLTIQDWYKPNPNSKEEIIICWENTVLFLVSSFQYVIIALIYSKGRPYRTILCTNYLLLLSALSLIGISTYLCVYPNEIAANFFNIIYVPLHENSNQRIFRTTLLFFPAVHLLTSYVIEFFVGETKLLKRIIHCVLCKKEPKNRYKKLLKNNDLWNEISR